MSGESHDIGEDDLHAYVDNQLAPERRAAVAHYLSENPDDAERVAGYIEMRDTLRAALAEQATLPMPARLNPHLIAYRRRTRQTIWRAAAAVVLAFGLGGGGGWVLHERLAPPPGAVTVVLREAMANHIVYTADRRRPTELGADQRDDLARWVSNRMNRQVAPPDLTSTGFIYIGGRLAATGSGPAGIFMYQNAANVRLTIFVRPVDGPTGNSAGNPGSIKDEARLEHVGAGPVDGYGWVSNGLGYSVIAAVPTGELHRVAEQVQQLVKPKA
jgi:anti-sigma factor RsiW